jgi:hypothetical protein
MCRHRLLAVFGLLVLAACGGSPTASLSVNALPNANLSAVSISFGSQVVGESIAGPAITLSNPGSAELRIVGISVASPFTATSTCGSSLAVGATCMINVTFTPTTEGDFTSKVAIADNAEGSPQMVALSGIGVPPIPPPPKCVPPGGACFGPGSDHCCPAPFPHHAFCSNPTGWGTCIEN